MFEHPNRSPDGIQKKIGIVFIELKSRSRSVVERMSLRIDDRVRQPTDGMHQRRSSINETIHLVQPTRLKSTRHQIDIRASFNPMGKTIIEADVGSNFVWELLL